MKYKSLIFFSVICTTITLSNDFHTEPQIVNYSLNNSVGFGTNIKTQIINDLSVSRNESRVYNNSISLINDLIFSMDNYESISFRLSMNYSPHSLSDLSLGNYTFINNLTNDIRVLPLTGKYENEAISLALGLSYILKFSEKWGFRFHALQIEINYQKKLNLKLDDNYIGFSIYDTEDEKLESIESFNYDKKNNFSYCSGISLIYSILVDNTLINQMDIEVGTFLKITEVEELDDIFQFQLALLFFY